MMMTKIDSKRAVDYGKREQAGKRPRARVSLFPLPIVPSALSLSFLPSIPQHSATTAKTSLLK